MHILRVGRSCCPPITDPSYPQLSVDIEAAELDSQTCWLVGYLSLAESVVARGHVLSILYRATSDPPAANFQILLTLSKKP